MFNENKEKKVRRKLDKWYMEKVIEYITEKISDVYAMDIAEIFEKCQINYNEEVINRRKHAFEGYVRLYLIRMISRIEEIEKMEEMRRPSIVCQTCGRTVDYQYVSANLKVKCPYCGNEQRLTLRQYIYFMLYEVGYAEDIQDNTKTMANISSLYNTLKKLWELDPDVEISLMPFVDIFIVKFSKEKTSEWRKQGVDIEQIVYYNIDDIIRDKVSVMADRNHPLYNTRAVIEIYFGDEKENE